MWIITNHVSFPHSSPFIKVNHQNLCWADKKRVKGSLCFLSLPWVINPEICSPQPEFHIPHPFLWLSYVCSRAWREPCCRNLTNVQIRLSPRLLNRGRKRILSQNKRWGANPFPCAVKQSLHSLLSKWHLIWFCCWSLRYPECFQDIYSGCCATLARYEGGEIWWAVTQPFSQKCATDEHTLTHTLYEWWKTSWNKTTGSRSDFTGYTRSCETVMEIQIGLTRVILRHHRSSVLNYNISNISFQRKVSLTQTRKVFFLNPMF